MLRNLIFVAAMAVVSLSAAVSRADWLMVGPYQFVPQSSSAAYGVYATGARSQSAGYMTATLNLPPGRTLLGMWCQVYDASANNINVNLAEVYTDHSGNGGQRVMLFLNSSGTPGHAPYASTTVLGSAVIKTFDNAGAGGANRFYTYILSANMDGSSSTAIKGCAIQYN